MNAINGPGVYPGVPYIGKQSIEELHETIEVYESALERERSSYELAGPEKHEQWSVWERIVADCRQELKRREEQDPRISGLTRSQNLRDVLLRAQMAAETLETSLRDYIEKERIWGGPGAVKDFRERLIDVQTETLGPAIADAEDKIKELLNQEAEEDARRVG